MIIGLTVEDEPLPYRVMLLDTSPVDVSSSSLAFLSLHLAFHVHATPASQVNTVLTEPKNLKQALSGPDGPEWRLAIISEFATLVQKGTFLLLHVLPLGAVILGTSIKYKLKLLSDGSLDKRKARLVAYDQEQVFERYYNETFAATASIDLFFVFIYLCLFSG